MKSDCKKVVCILTLLCLTACAFIPGAAGERTAWNCPECGRQGNTGNYCGGCAHPAPWIETITTPPPASTPAPTPEPTSTPTPEPTSEPRPEQKPLNITGVSREDDHEVRINWEGGNGQVSVLVMHYFNDNHNEGIEKCRRIDNWANTGQNGSGTVFNIVPGQRYWIKLSDSEGQSAWFDYTDPMGAEPDVKVTLKRINFSSYGNNGFHSVSGVTAARIEKTCRNSPNYDENQNQILIAASLGISKLEKPGEVWFSWALSLPNGDFVDCSIGYPEYVRKNGGWIQNTGISWDNIYDAYGCIPTGKYTYYFGVGRYFVGSKSFQLR